MPKEVDGMSPKWLRCCATIMGRFRIAQALDEEMSPEEQRQQQQLGGPSGPANHLLGEADGTCPELFKEGNCPPPSPKMTSVDGKASNVVTFALLSAKSHL